MIFVMRVLVATLVVVAVLLADFPERVSRQAKGIMRDFKLGLFELPIAEVRVAECSGSCIAFHGAPGTDVQLVVEGDQHAEVLPGENVRFEVTGSKKQRGVLSWRPHSLDSDVTFSTYEGDGPGRGHHISWVNRRMQIPVVIRHGTHGYIWVEEWVPRPVEGNWRWRSDVDDP